MRKFLKTTIVGGAVFLLPLVIVGMLLNYAVGYAVDVAEPALESVGVNPREDIAGVGLASVIAGVGLVILCFGAGLIARTAIGDKVTGWIERSVLGRLPQYQMMKSMASAYGELDNTKGLQPCLVCIEGGWQVGYLVETLDNGWKAVFMPQAPTPMSGNIMYFLAERVHPLNITMIEATRIIQRLGIGSNDWLKNADFEIPEGQK